MGDYTSGPAAMMMSPRVRRFALLAHITFSVGWLGAVSVFLGLAVIGMTSEDSATVRGAYLVMEPAARLVLVPLAVASLATGVIQSLGTEWGLVRHYWVLSKMLLNALSLVILAIYMETFRSMAAVAADPGAALAAVRNPSPALHAVLALGVLLIATFLAVYKPGGMTPYGRRTQHIHGDVRVSPWIYAAGLAVVLMLLMIAAHLSGGGLHRH